MWINVDPAPPTEESGQGEIAAEATRLLHSRYSLYNLFSFVVPLLEY